MSIADNKIQCTAGLTPEIKKVMSAVNAATASVLDVQAANISIPEKALLLAVRAGTATRVAVNGSSCSPMFKGHCLDIAAV